MSIHKPTTPRLNIAIIISTDARMLMSSRDFLIGLNILWKAWSPDILSNWS